MSWAYMSSAYMSSAYMSRLMQQTYKLGSYLTEILLHIESLGGDADYVICMLQMKCI